MKDRSKQFSKKTWKDPTRSLSRLAKIESKLVRLFRNYRRRVLAELKPSEQPFTQMEVLLHGGEGSGNFGHAGRPGEVGGSGPGGGNGIIKEEGVNWDIISMREARVKIEQKEAVFSWVSTGTFIDMQYDAAIKAGSTSSKDRFLAVADPERIEELKTKMASGNTFQSLAVEYDSQGEIKDFQEGRHRALAAKELGIKKLPVWFFIDKPKISDAPRTYGKPTYPRDLIRSQERYGYENIATLEKTLLDLPEQHRQKWPASFSIEHFFQRLEDIARQVLIGPANAVIEKEIPDAYTHGTKYADLNIKATTGIVLGAPLEERQKHWQRVGALVEGSKGDFKGVSDEVNKRIRKIISDGMVNESSFGDVQREIVRAVDEVGIVRAAMIARTETMKAINTGVIDRYEAAGIEKVEWLAAEDERTCPECGELDGQIFDIDKAPPCPFHPLCRCTLIVTEESLGIAEEEESTQKYRQIVQGGPGSGNFGHAGRPGEVGGSGPGGDIGEVPFGFTKDGYIDITGDDEESERGTRKAYDDLPQTNPAYSIKNYSIDEEHAVSSYSGNPLAFEINDTLRFDPHSERFQDVIKNMTGMIDKAPGLPDGLEVYRGYRGNIADAIANLEIGDEISDKGFQSTTLDPDHACSFSKLFDENGERRTDYVMTRHIMKGGEKAIAGSYKEKELIFQRGSSWKVVGKKVFPRQGKEFSLTVITVIKS